VNLLAERGIELRSLKMQIDMATPIGKLLFHIMAAMTEFERDVIRERTQTCQEAERARGRRGGRPRAIEHIEARNLARAKALYVARQNTIISQARVYDGDTSGTSTSRFTSSDNSGSWMPSA